MTIWRGFLLLGFCALLAFLLLALSRHDATHLPSVLQDKPFPQLTLPDLLDEQATLTLGGQSDSPILVNVWASWCAPCRVEHPHLMALAEQGVVIYGINYKDDSKLAKRFLSTLGNPYRAVAVDGDGRASIDLGVYGVPETFVVSREGRVLARHTGPLLQADRDRLITEFF